MMAWLRDRACLGNERLSDASKLIGLVVDALRDVADVAGATEVAHVQERSRIGDLLDRLRPPFGVIRRLPEQLPARPSRKRQH